MWRRVASQSPDSATGPNRQYIKAFAAIGQMLTEGRSLSGHERNCCFLNTRDGRFATISAASGLDFPEDGRAIGLTDWDHDGDVDVWLGNRTGPRLRFMRNDCQGNSRSITVKLRGTTCNRDAIGARLELVLAVGNQPSHQGKSLRLIRTVRAGHGFLSQASKRIHFGVGSRSVQNLVVRWPDGSVEEFGSLQVGKHYEIVQGTSTATTWTRPTDPLPLTASRMNSAPPTGQSRIVITGRLPMPAIDFTAVQEDSKRRPAAPTLLNLWSTTCMPCLKELAEFTRCENQLREAGLKIVALNVDELMEDPNSDFSRSKRQLSEIGFPFAAAGITPAGAGTLDIFHQAFLSLRLPLPVPSSFLATADGRIAVIYRGPVAVEQLLDDLELVDLDAESIRRRAVPFGGRWHTQPIHADVKQHATAFMRGGFIEEGAKYLENYLLTHANGKGFGPRESWPSSKRLAELCESLADFYRLQNQPGKVLSAFRLALKFDPNNVTACLNLGKAMIETGKITEGITLLQRAAQLAPANVTVASDLAIAYAMTGRTKPAEQIFLRLLKQNPDSSATRLNLGRLYFQQRRFTEARAQLAEQLKLEPNSVEALKLLCWILASSPSDGDRNPRMAHEYVQRLLRQTQEETAESHDLVAAIHAELGDFDKAIEEARRAVQLARDQKSASSVAGIEQRLQLYLSRQPYRLP
jgi:tetratricopeptide (TPR) repeat protein/thiol-disulfide isomerase/thioredoxin